MDFIRHLEKLKTRHLWLLSVLFSIVASEAIVVVISLILKGLIDPDFLITGMVTSLIVASIVTAVIVSFLDALKKANEEILRKKQAAEIANQAKSQFLSSMSHELRTPLNAIIGFSQILEMSLQAPEDKEHIQFILKSGWHLLDLVNDVLDLAKIEAGQMKFSLEPVDMDELAQECINWCRTLAEQRGMDIQLAMPGSQPIFVQADRIRLKQAVLNYLSNAVKYGRPGGHIRLLTSTRNGKVRVEVINDGMGIEPDKLRELFTPFSRLGHESSNIEGAGLGLSLTRQMVEQMGGQSGAQSEVGKGSTFWLELPAIQRVA